MFSHLAGTSPPAIASIVVIGSISMVGAVGFTAVAITAVIALGVDLTGFTDNTGSVNQD